MKALESAVEILEKQFEACESVRVEVSELDAKGSPPNESAFLDFTCMVFFAHTLVTSIWGYSSHGQGCEWRFTLRWNQQLQRTSSKSLTHQLLNRRRQTASKAAARPSNLRCSKVTTTEVAARMLGKLEHICYIIQAVVQPVTFLNSLSTKLGPLVFLCVAYQLCLTQSIWHPALPIRNVVKILRKAAEAKQEWTGWCFPRWPEVATVLGLGVQRCPTLSQGIGKWIICHMFWNLILEHDLRTCDSCHVLVVLWHKRGMLQKIVRRKIDYTPAFLLILLLVASVRHTGENPSQTHARWIPRWSP